MFELTIIYFKEKGAARRGEKISEGAITDGDSTIGQSCVFSLLTFMTNAMAFNHVVLDHETILF